MSCQPINIQYNATYFRRENSSRIISNQKRMDRISFCCQCQRAQLRGLLIMRFVSKQVYMPSRAAHGDAFIVFMFFRSRRSEPARRSVRQRATPTGHCSPAYRRDGSPGRPAVRHIETTSRVTRLRQQNTREVGECYIISWPVHLDLYTITWPHKQSIGRHTNRLKACVLINGVDQRCWALG